MGRLIYIEEFTCGIKFVILYICPNRKSSHFNHSNMLRLITITKYIVTFNYMHMCVNVVN